MEKEKRWRLISSSLQMILYLLVYGYSIQTFLKQNALMGEISVKIGVESNLRYTK